MGEAVSVAHLAAMVFAAFRLTEIMTMDTISAPIRRRWPLYIWSCPRCVSVWAGAATTFIFVTVPWLNWPLALSWFYLVEIDWRRVRQMVPRA